MRSPLQWVRDRAQRAAEADQPLTPELRGRLNSKMDGTPLTYGEAAVLMILADSPGRAFTAFDLADELLMQDAMADQCLARLLGLGMVRRNGGNDRLPNYSIDLS
jgi:DNA-binding MarR family transcriptional regulator